MIVIKVTTKDGAEKYYTGKRDKKGRYILSDREDAKEYKSRSGSLNYVINMLELQGMKADYVEE